MHASTVPTLRRLLPPAEIAIPVMALLVLALVVIPQLSMARGRGDAGLMEARLASLQRAIDEYRLAMPDHQAPDLVHEGWTPLIRAGVLRERPTNPANGQAAVGERGAPGLGWVYDAQTGRLQACVYGSGLER